VTKFYPWFWTSFSVLEQRYLTSYMLVDVALLFIVSAVVTDGLLFILRKEWRSQPSESNTSFSNSL
jgi:hypothetical protein